VELTPAELRQFAFGGTIGAIAPQPGGHINRSYRVETAGPAGPGLFLVQRVNASVFQHPAALMANIAAITRHIAGLDPEATSLLPAQHRIMLVPTTSGQQWLEAQDGSVWRAFPHIAGATHARAAQPSQARVAGLAFGAFLGLMDSYSGEALAQTLPHFHDTSWYFDELERVAAVDPQGRFAGAEPEFRACLAQRALASALPHAGTEGVRQRVVHNDAKIANVLFDRAYGDPLAVIDLDTTMPGSAFADAGDLLRSMASPTSEDEGDLSKVRAEPALVEAVLEGWYEGAGEALSHTERSGAVLAGCVITLEQAVRFLADHLAGDVYYQVADPAHNLRRARTQLALLASMLTQRASFERRAARHITSTG
jgi:aminoglycoside phosphotransferase (APT) family kinase protein